MRSSFASRCSTSCRRAGVSSKWRAVMATRMDTALIKDFPLVGRGDLELLAVFGDGAARQHQPFLLQDADDLRVAQRLARIFVLDDLADPLLDGDRGNAVAIRAADAAVEEVLQLEHALRRVHVLVVHDTAD